MSIGILVKPLDLDAWTDAQRFLQRPESTLRVVSAEVGPPELFGAGGRLRVNPWIDSCNSFTLSQALDAGHVEDLVSYGLPLSIAIALESPMPAAVQIALLSSLRSLAHTSRHACDQLNAHQRTHLKLGSSPGKPASALVSEVEQSCRQRLVETGHQLACRDWTEFGSAYEVWLPHGGGMLKVHLSGEQNKGAASYDFGGVHLTGGRIWTGSLLLARWLASLHFASDPGSAEVRRRLQGGPVLEVGSGLGLVGIALAKLGHRVVLSDREPILLDRVRDNIELNGVEASCRVLSFDWARAPKMRRLLQAQQFSAVVGADVVYTDSAADLLVGVVSCSLPVGGLAFFVNAARHRKGIDAFAGKLRAAGHEVAEGVIPCEPCVQDLICGSFEPDQEYVALAVQVAERQQSA